MRVRAPEDLSVQHPGKTDVVRVARPAGGLGQAVHFAHGAADGGEAVAGVAHLAGVAHGSSHRRIARANVAPAHTPTLSTGAPRGPSLPRTGPRTSPPNRFAAASTAS